MNLDTEVINVRVNGGKQTHAYQEVLNVQSKG